MSLKPYILFTRVGEEVYEIYAVLYTPELESNLARAANIVVNATREFGGPGSMARVEVNLSPGPILLLPEAITALSEATKGDSDKAWCGFCRYHEDLGDTPIVTLLEEGLVKVHKDDAYSELKVCLSGEEGKNGVDDCLVYVNGWSPCCGVGSRFGDTWEGSLSELQEERRVIIQAVKERV